MMYPAGFTTTFASSLQDLKTAAPQVVAQYSPQQLKYGCVDFNCDTSGEYLAPYDFSGWVFAYNKKIFKQVGVTVPFKSWDDMVSAGEKLKAAGYTPFQMGNRDGYIADAWLSAMYTSYLQPDDINSFLSGQLKLTDAKFVDPLTKWNELYKDGLVNENACTLEVIASERDFFAGKAASVASFEYAKLYQRMGANVGLFTVPPIDGAPNSANAGTAAQVGEGWTVTKFTKNLPLATAFLAAITSAQSQTEAFEMAGTPPANPKASVANPGDPISGEASEQFLGYKLLSLNTVMPLETQVDYFKQTAQGLCGKESPQSAMAAVQSTFEKESSTG